MEGVSEEPAREATGPPDARPGACIERSRLEDLSVTAYIDMRARLRQAEELNDLLRIQADTDPLTGLLNARGFERRTRHADWGWFVVSDLNGFKRFQDEPGRGHEWGDRVLREHAEYLIGLVRQREFRAGMVLIARTGGDEFTIWTETRTGARRVRDCIRTWHSEHGPVTASAGLGQTREAADSAMYLDKTGRSSA